MKTRGALNKKVNVALISQIEPKKVEEALKDSSWVQAMQEELDQFDKNQVWELLTKPANATVVGTKWIFRNKLNEDGKELIQKFGMSSAKAIGTPVSPSTSLDKDEKGNSVDETKYRGMIGSLLYLFQSAPKESYMTAVKRIIRYLIGTISYGLWYPRSNNFKLEGFSDVDLAGDNEDRKSTSGIYQLLGKALISWNSKKQGSVALSTTEAKYNSIGQCCAQLLWISHQLGDPDLVEKLTTIDNNLIIIKDLLAATQSTVGDIHAISKEAGFDVSKIRVKILKLAENAVKAFKEVHDRIDGVTVSANASFERLKESICNTLTYFLRRYLWMFQTMFFAILLFWTG
uniref:Reverse transcriptase Ty1/copia-type domain-containing protein n=1 Tax=Nicotiana tabacum TaxID=4097 RepID=A0A1S3YQI7_TOBAC|nr:PREDICTED: uncharacterized protein LOC107778626 [Nicotiana tabacum]